MQRDPALFLLARATSDQGGAMPADFELDTVERTVRSRALGIVTDENLFNQVERIRTLFEQGILDSTWAQVCDFTAAERFDCISSDEIRRLAGSNPWPKASLRAIVVPSDLGFGLGRMYEMLCGTAGENVCVVRSAADALAWLTHRRGSIQQARHGDEEGGPAQGQSAVEFHEHSHLVVTRSDRRWRGRHADRRHRPARRVGHHPTGFCFGGSRSLPRQKSISTRVLLVSDPGCSRRRRVRRVEQVRRHRGER